MLIYNFAYSFFKKMGLNGFDSKTKRVVSMPGYEVVARYQRYFKQQLAKITSRLLRKHSVRGLPLIPA